MTFDQLEQRIDDGLAILDAIDTDPAMDLAWLCANDDENYRSLLDVPADRTVTAAWVRTYDVELTLLAPPRRTRCTLNRVYNFRTGWEPQ